MDVLFNTVGVQLLVVVLGLIIEYFIVQPFTASKGPSVSLTGREPIAVLAAGAGLLVGIGLLIFAVVDVLDQLAKFGSTSGGELFGIGTFVLMLLLYAAGISMYVLYRTRTTALVQKNRNEQRRLETQPTSPRPDALLGLWDPWHDEERLRQNKARERARKLRGELNEWELMSAALVSALISASLFLPLFVIWLFTFLFPSQVIGLIALPFAALPAFTYFYLGSLEREQASCLVRVFDVKSFLEVESVKKAMLITGAIFFPCLLAALAVTSNLGSFPGLVLMSLAISFLAIPMLWVLLLIACFQVAKLTVYLFPQRLKLS